MKQAIILCIATLLSTSALACDVSKISISNAFVLAGPPGQENTAGYGVLKNTGNTACEITSVESTISQKTELHTIVHEGNMMKMQPVKSFAVPANGEFTLQRGGNHLMFISLKEPLKIGTTVPVTLQFADGMKVVDFAVKDMKG